MGSTRFWGVVRTFWHDHRYQIVTTKQLLEAFRAKAGDWVLPRYRVPLPVAVLTARWTVAGVSR